MPKQRTAWNIGWQAIFGILLVGIVLLAFMGQGKEKTELPPPEVMDAGNGIKLVYYPPQWPGAPGKSCVESTRKDGVFVQDCADGKVDFNYVLAKVQEIENTDKPLPLPEEKSEAQLEMENILSTLNAHLTNIQNCIAYANSATSTKGDENKEAYWWGKYEDENCPTANESELACYDLAKALEKRAQAPYWFSSSSSEYGKYLTTSNYDTVFKAYRDLGCKMEDVNIPQNQLSCLEQGIKIDEINTEAKKAGIKPNEVFTQYLQNYIATCLK